MKKIFLAGALFMLATAGKISAQSAPPISEVIVTKDFAPTANGPQTIQIPNGWGTLKFDRNGDKISNVVFVEATSLKNHRALLVNTFPKPNMEASCKYPLPDACFATADKTIGMCVCKPTDLTSNTYIITMLLPAIHKVREAASKN